MRDWFSGRMTAFQAVEKGSIPLSRTQKSGPGCEAFRFLIFTAVRESKDGGREATNFSW